MELNCQYIQEKIVTANIFTTAVSPSERSSHIASTHVLPLITEIKFHIFVKQQATLWFGTVSFTFFDKKWEDTTF
jgi:hypothetical protein